MVVTRSFPPMENTAALRPAAWARHLHKYGFYPIFLTTCEQEFEEGIEENEHYTVHRIATGTSFFRSLSNQTNISVLRKLFSFFDIMLDNIFLYSSQNKLMPTVYDIVEKYEPCACVISGPPFSLFHIGHELKASYNLPWIADYRDDWTTNEETHVIVKTRNILESFREKKLMKNADHYLAVSEYQLIKIGNLIDCDGTNLPNGYEVDNPKIDFGIISKFGLSYKTAKLRIGYLGTIYDSQKLEFLLQVLQRLNNEVLQNIEFIFVGSDLRKLMKIKGLSKYLDETIKVLPRVEKVVADCILKSCDLGLYIAYSNSKGDPIQGVPSSKLYEYIKFKKPVIFMPSDEDVAFDTMNKIGLAEGSDNIAECAQALTSLMNEKVSKEQIIRSVNHEELESHKAENKVVILANVLKRIIDA